MIYTVSANPALDLTLTVPVIEFETVLRATGVRRAWAGKGFNVSRFLKKLGIENVAFAFAAGHTGRALAEGLHELGIQTHFVMVDGETRTNVVIEEPDGHHIKVNQPGAAVTGADIATFHDQVRAVAAPGDVWVLTGSLAPGMAVDFYADLARVLHAAGAQVVLDTSGAALRAGMAGRPEFVKPNTVEATEYLGAPVTSIEAAAAAAMAFQRGGADHVVLSMGKDGAIAADATGCWRVTPPAIQARTGVSAGDALVAGSVLALRRGLQMPEIARWGVAVGTLAAMRDDLPPDPWPELDDLLGRVEVTPLA